MWGTYWVWDARLTSVLILFFLYLGLMALRSSIEDETLAAKLTAILALVGVAILPFIKISVEGLEIPSLDISIPGMEHAASAVERVEIRRAVDPSRPPAASADFGAGLYAVVLRHASESHAQRDPAPSCQGADHWPKSRAAGAAKHGAAE